MVMMKNLSGYNITTTLKISGWESADVAKAEVLKAIEAAKK